MKTTGWAYGFMDKTGAMIVEPEFGELGDMRAGRALFEDDDAYGFIDATGARVIEAVYDEARAFSGGRAAVRQGTRWFYNYRILSVGLLVVTAALVWNFR